MAESRVHELLSGLIVTLRSYGAEARKTAKGLPDSRDALKYLDSSRPQVMIYTRKAHGNCAHTFISDNIVSQLGYVAQDFVQDPDAWDRNIHPEDVQKASTRISELFETGHMVQEYRFRHKDGRHRWLRDELNLIKDDHGNPSEILGSLIDVTERRRVEQALREGEARHHSLVDNAPMGMISFDKDGEITGFNPAVLSILGASHLEVADARDLFSLLPLVEAGISEAIVQCLESGDSGVGEFQYKSKGDRQVYSRVHVVPIRDDDKRITGAHAFLMDISDQKRAEELIVSSERLKVLGQISSGVSHTFSNLLQVVSGSANMALTSLDLKDIEGAKANLEQIVESTRSATEAVRWLQQFARGRSGAASQKQEAFDLAEAVEEAIEMCKLWSKPELDRKRVKIEYELDLTRGCHIEGIPDQIAWVALNILKNAVEAMPKGGKIKTRTYLKDRTVILSVQDNGIGIPPKDIKHITTSFWSSKDAHAGMGLPFSCGILRTHGGTLGVKRVKPRGSMFLVRLPYVNPLMKRSPKDSPGKGLRILFVDDDERIVKVFERGFRVLGQTLIPAYSGEQALAIYRQSPVDAIVCDLAMPGMNGWEVGKAVQTVSAEKGSSKPPFILLTGWARQLEEEEIAANSQVDRIVQKPVKVPFLLEVIQEEIGRSQSQGDFSGSIGGIDILEYVQLLLLNGRQALVEIQSRDGEQGLVYVDRGEIVHAKSGALEGEEALYNCLLFKGGNFSSLPWREPERITIDKPGVFLLIEAARKRDERNETAGSAKQEVSSSE
ncbi:MAG: PAS domain S-box protein [Desulfomonile tiedjei]|uniref:histidine kinase n=1 Tax=Desulfomonile tiedjei TaxID=2358 RepID=A0A9D6Z579_9BACT|nr:PAS domain S-box protein [Desulfomonile tiedjei]